MLFHLMAQTKAPAKKPKLDEDERDRRWKLIREGMSKQGIDLLVTVPQWMNVDSLYVANEPGAVIFPLEGEPWIVLGGEDSHRAVDRPGQWITQRSSATPGGSTRAPFGAAVGDVIKKLGLKPKRLAIAGLDGHDFIHVRMPEGYVGYTTAKQISAAVPDAELIDGSDVLAWPRGVKSEIELDLLRFGLGLTERAVIAIGEALDQGGTQAEAYRGGTDALLVPEADGGHIAWCPAAWGEERPRLTSPPPGEVTPGLCVAVEAMSVVRGYEPALAEPFLIGDINAEQEEAFALNNLAFDTALAALKPGRTWGEIEREVIAVAEGTNWKIDFLLHGRGMGHDGPLLIPTDSHERYEDVPVREGAVFVVKPNAFPRRFDVAQSRSHDVNWGDTVVVKAGGGERLGTRSRELRSYGP